MNELILHYTARTPSTGNGSVDASDLARKSTAPKVLSSWSACPFPPPAWPHHAGLSVILQTPGEVSCLFVLLLKTFSLAWNVPCPLISLKTSNSVFKTPLRAPPLEDLSQPSPSLIQLWLSSLLILVHPVSYTFHMYLFM